MESSACVKGSLVGASLYAAPSGLRVAVAGFSVLSIYNMYSSTVGVLGNTSLPKHAPHKILSTKWNKFSLLEISHHIFEAVILKACFNF